MSRIKPWNHHGYARVHVSEVSEAFTVYDLAQPEHSARAIVWMDCITGTPVLWQWEKLWSIESSQRKITFDSHALRYPQRCTASHQIEKTSRSTAQSALFRATLSCWFGTQVLFWVCVFDVVLRDESPRTQSLVLLRWFGEEWNTSLTKSQRSRAGIPSVRKPASRQIISVFVELCETEVCFLHIQLNAQESTWCWFWVFQVFDKIRVLKQSWSALLCCLSHMTMLLEFTCVMNVWDQTC